MFHVQINVLPANGGAPEQHTCLADSDASYTALPVGCDQSPPLLGASALETFGLDVDPLGKWLIRADGYLAAAMTPIAARRLPTRSCQVR